LFQTFQNQILSGAEGKGAFKVAGHLLVGRVARVLLVHHSGHALQGFNHLFVGNDAVQQPVGNVLAGDTQGRAVFHQTDVVDVRYFGAAHALVNPAHHVTQDALGVVVQLFLDFLGGPVGVRRHGNGQDAVQVVVGVAFQTLLDVDHVDLVVVQGVQRGSGRRWYPGGVATGLHVTNLLLQHFSHQVGHGPHAFTDLGTTTQTALQADLNVVALVGRLPVSLFHVGLAHYGASLHASVDFVAST